MLYVKIMSGEDLPDTDPCKNYTIVPLQNNEVMQFVRNQESLVWESGAQEVGPRPCRYQLEIHAPDGGIETHDLSGNAYVMNESGKTIATHAC
jgi:hypothetical protein